MHGPLPGELRKRLPQTPNLLSIPPKVSLLSLPPSFSHPARRTLHLSPSSSVMHLSGVWAALRGGTSSPSPHPDDPSVSPHDHYTRPRHSRRRTNGSSGVHRVNNQPRSNSSPTVLCGLFKMPPLFNLIRIGVFGAFLPSPSPRLAIY